MEFYTLDILEDEDYLAHYGTKRHSGRYPWGSGESPFQHSGDFLSRIAELKKANITYVDPETGQRYSGETAIAKTLGMTTGQYRAAKSIANYEQRSLLVDKAKSLKADGLGATEIGKIMGANESTVRSWLNEASESRMNEAMKTAEFLKTQVSKKGMLDVGIGVERELGVSRDKLNVALSMLEMEGYPTYGGRIDQVTNSNNKTTLKVLCPPGTEHKDIYNPSNIHSVKDYISYDGGDTFKKSFVYPESLDSKRLKIRYAEDGGIDKDGVIELRRGVADLDLGNSKYAQVRILVDGDRYLKGMAVYADDKDMPKGVDVIFNTNKKSDVPMRDVLKKIKDDPDNPFGSAIKDQERGGQYYYKDKNGKEKLGLLNKTREEADWSDWKDKVPSQFLAKQSMPLIKKQLKISMDEKQAEFDEICSLTNPTIKKALLKSYADDCDSAAVHLKAASLPGQKYHVILPLKSIKDTEVYAPNYKDGETVALIRYPHGGTFEIPIVKVNNKNREAQRLMGKTPTDAIGINSKVAERLSGADFDGDTVMVIPCNSPGKVKISSTLPLKGLEGFDPKNEYPARPGMRYMKYETVDKNGKKKTVDNTQIQMGMISNLITDMTLKGANQDELARAVRHSMVVIDAAKHGLDYKRSEKENGIAELKKIYQGEIDPKTGRMHTGASTLISRAKSEQQVYKRQGSAIIDPKTGKQTWKLADDLEYVDRKGNIQKRTQRSTKMAEVDDAFDLVSDYNTPQEQAYAQYANKMKSLANEARKVMVNTGKIAYSKAAKDAYQQEVNSLEAKLNIALKNAPRERQAQAIANSVINAKKQDNPDMSKDELKKHKQRALTNARASVGAKRETITITDREWEAIQAGAISETTLKKIINNTDIDALRKRATPRATTTLSTAKVNKAKAMMASGNYTTAQIANSLGVSASTISKYVS